MVQWVHNGVEVMNDAENVEISNDDGRSVLVLRNVGLGSGGNYTCEVGNSMGHNLLSFTVTIITEEVASTFTEGIDLGKPLNLFVLLHTHTHTHTYTHTHAHRHIVI